MYTLENQALSIAVNPVGAELSSLRWRAGDRELLWNADPKIWRGHAPLLFPIVGKLKGDAYTYEGQDYSMPKHGFAMGKTFRLAEQGAAQMTFLLEDDEATRACFPFAFTLAVSFILEDSTLRVLHRVHNPASTPMYFSLGAHPGFACGMGDTLVFERRETLRARRLDASYLLGDEDYPFLQEEQVFEITPQSFAKDALILENPKSTFLTLKRGGQETLRMRFGRVPFLGLWAKPAAPYVCIEPWYGVDDDHHQSGDLTQKRGIVKLPGRAEFFFEYDVDVLL